MLLLTLGCLKFRTTIIRILDSSHQWLIKQGDKIFAHQKAPCPHTHHVGQALFDVISLSNFYEMLSHINT